MSYTQILQTVQSYHAQLVAVSKTKPVSDIQQLYNQGQRVFGENKVQEMCEKKALLPDDIKWHLIGHLQTNKVKFIAPFVSMIHSVDSIKLMQEIEKEAAKHQRIIPILLQIYIANEDTKFGLDNTSLIELLDYYISDVTAFSHIQIAGVMGMASFTENQEQIRQEFRSLSDKFNFIKQSYFPLQQTFKEISMGMSSDYEIALAAGSTMVRIGSLLFGARHA